MVSGIIENVRDFLADVDGDRWDDYQLINLVDRAQKDIALKSHTLRSKYRFGISDDQEVYTLPDDLLRITRITVNDIPVQLKSHADLDRLVGEWEGKIGSEISYIVYDKLTEGTIKPYPIITGINEIVYQAEDDYGLWSNLGDDDYGVIVDLPEITGEIVGDGTTTEIISGTLVLTVYYVKRPKTITSLNDEIELDDVWISAIEHYVQGKALRNDKDTQSRVLGNEEIQLYNAELKELKKVSSRDFTQAVIFETEYRRI